MEGILYVSITPGNYAISSPYHPDITRGQAVDLLLGGHWIPGHIDESNLRSDPSSATEPSASTQNVGAYTIQLVEHDDRVTEASEESFPASDPPAWAASSSEKEQNTAHSVSGFYFIAEVDNSVCGLCSGMRLRIR